CCTVNVTPVAAPVAFPSGSLAMVMVWNASVTASTAAPPMSPRFGSPVTPYHGLKSDTRHAVPPGPGQNAFSASRNPRNRYDPGGTRLNAYGAVNGPAAPAGAFPYSSSLVMMVKASGRPVPAGGGGRVAANRKITRFPRAGPATTA